jgi:hypothetical protein
LGCRHSGIYCPAFPEAVFVSFSNEKVKLL